MGKNGKFGKVYGTVVGKDSKSRPGWKGPAYVKKVEAPKSSKKPAEEEDEDEVLEPVIPAELQQVLLNIFRDAFPEVLTSDGLQQLLQDVKAALFERDFGRAFGKEEYLEAYSIRWSPTRALGYTAILVDLRNHLASVFPPCAESRSRQTVAASGSSVSSMQSSLNAICFGGGAAEVIGFGGFLRYLYTSTPEVDFEEPDALEALENLSVAQEKARADLLLIDTARWKNVVEKLHTGLITPPPLSKYASASARAANKSLLESEDISATFSAKDVLELSKDQIEEMVGKKPMLVTLLFTLNELYTASIGKTTTFLLNLTAAVPPGTLLLVVDSPGSYSETTIGAEAKKYPMLWLLNHTLLETEKSRGQESTPKWKTLVSEESRWFKIPESLRYSIKLESMRYQIHLYSRT